MAVIAGTVAVVAGVIVGGIATVQSLSQRDDSGGNASLASDPLTPSATASVSGTAAPSASATASSTAKNSQEPTKKPTSRAASGEKTTAPTRRAASTSRSSTTTKKATTASSTTKASSAATVKVADPSVNLAASKSVQTGGHVQDYVASNITDGDVSTYWEAEAGFPQTVTVDLGSLQTVGRLQLALPPVSDWNSRTQTIAISGSRTGSSWSQLKGAAGYTFDANSSSQNAVSTSFTQARVRYLRLTFTANSGWSAAQLSELRAHSS